MSEPIDGLASNVAFLGRLDDAARDELAVELAILGREGLALQQAATPRDTGRLGGGLSLQLLVDKLKIRLGLLGLKRGRSKLFYGVIVYTGRKAQTVLVTRRIKQRTLKGNNKKNGTRRRTILEGKPYKMKVRARAGVPYIDAPGADFAKTAEGQLAEYWSRTFARAGGAS